MSGLNSPELPLCHLRAVLKPFSPVRLSDFPGSAWRGALGHSLKRMVCVTRMSRCAACMLYHSCVYSYFYDTPPDPDAAKMRRYTAAPHPFVLVPQKDYQGGDYRLGIVLIGQAARHLPVFVHALQRCVERGKGVGGNRMQLLRLEQESAPGEGDWRVVFQPGAALAALPAAMPAVPPAPSRFSIEVISPLRIKRESRRVGPDDFRFSDLFNNLLRRVSMLMEFHTACTLETDFRALTDRARDIRVGAQLKWQDQTRYSSRQKTAMQMGGVIGTVTVRDQPMDAFWPYLWLGQWVHAGSGATMGLGRYRIVAEEPGLGTAASSALT